MAYSGQIGPSLLACDLSKLAAESQRVIDAGADYLHLDVMDGHFVPNISWGPPVIKSLRKALGPAVFLDTHLMVSEPEKWVEPMADAGASQLIFHIEATQNPEALITKIRSAGMKVGVAIKPKTDIEELNPIVEQVDLILVMTVEPGFGGQKFMSDMMPKVETLRARFPSIPIEVDGGLGPSTIETAAQAGANWIVAGSSVFKEEDPTNVIQLMRGAVNSAAEKRQAA